METKLYNTQGKEAGTLTLPESVFAAKWNDDLVHQVVVAMQANARTPVAHTKDRSEVQGTTRKPWRQKGTGNARHGSRRSPIWRTGGVAHGPRNEKNFKKQINKKMRVKALYAVLAKKHADGEVLFVDELACTESKTKEAKAILTTFASIKGYEELETKKKNTALIATIEGTENTRKSFQNIGNVALEQVRNLNPVTLLKYKYLIIVGGKEAVSQIEARGTASTTVNSK